MKKGFRVLGIVIALFLLILVRYYENILFYDPFLAFFKQYKFKQLVQPEFHTAKLLASLLFRFILNSILSIIILQLWFNDKQISRFSGFILGIGFIIFCLLYLVSILTNFGLGYMPTFFIRRILIQPIFLFLLIPAIYYYKHLKK